MRSAARCSAFSGTDDNLVSLATARASSLAISRCAILGGGRARALCCPWSPAPTRSRDASPRGSQPNPYDFLLSSPLQHRHFMQPIISVENLSKTYALRLRRAEKRQSGDQEGEIFALLGAERRRQDDADQHRLRHRHAVFGKGSGRRSRISSPTTAPRDRCDRIACRNT